MYIVVNSVIDKGVNNFVYRYITDLMDILRYRLVKFQGESYEEVRDIIDEVIEDFETEYPHIVKEVSTNLIQEDDIFDIIIDLDDDVIDTIIDNNLISKKQVSIAGATNPLFISNGIRYSHATHGNSTSTTKNDISESDLKLIERVGFHMNHESVLEHSLLIFDIKMSTKALLEESRHRIGVSQTVTSSRYALRKINVLFEENKNPIVNKILLKEKELITEALNTYDKKELPDEDLAMALPQAFIYEAQLSFNLRSLKHFLDLRLDKSAHETIRKIAVNIMQELEDKYPNYFRLLMNDNKIKKSYEASYNDKLKNIEMLTIQDRQD